MKNIILIVFVCILVGCGSPSNFTSTSSVYLADEQNVEELEYQSKAKQYRILSEGFDRDNDGIIDKMTSYTYDAHGNALTQTIDNDGYGSGGAVDEYHHYYYVYNKDGSVFSVMEDNDEWTTVYMYDSMGRKIRETEKYIEYIYTYDNKNNVISVKIDLDHDGIVNIVHSYTYDKYCNILIDSFVDIEDSSIKIISYSYIYNIDGIMKSKKITSDSGFSETEYFIYDNNKNVILKTIDSGSDGTIDSRYKYAWIEI